MNSLLKKIIILDDVSFMIKEIILSLDKNIENYKNDYEKLGVFSFEKESIYSDEEEIGYEYTIYMPSLKEYFSFTSTKNLLKYKSLFSILEEKIMKFAGIDNDVDIILLSILNYKLSLLGYSEKTECLSPTISIKNILYLSGLNEKTSSEETKEILKNVKK